MTESTTTAPIAQSTTTAPIAQSTTTVLVADEWTTVNDPSGKPVTKKVFLLNNFFILLQISNKDIL